MSFIEDPYIFIADLITSATHNESLVDLLLSMLDEYSLKVDLLTTGNCKKEDDNYRIDLISCTTNFSEQDDFYCVFV